MIAVKLGFHVGLTAVCWIPDGPMIHVVHSASSFDSWLVLAFLCLTALFVPSQLSFAYLAVILGLLPCWLSFPTFLAFIVARFHCSFWLMAHSHWSFTDSVLIDYLCTICLSWLIQFQAYSNDSDLLDSEWRWHCSITDFLGSITDCFIVFRLLLFCYLIASFILLIAMTHLLFSNDSFIVVII